MCDKAYLTGKEFVKIIINCTELYEIDTINTMMNSINWNPNYIENIIISLYLANKVQLTDNWNSMNNFISLVPFDKLQSTFKKIYNSDNCDNCEISFIVLQLNPNLNATDFACRLCDNPDNLDNLNLTLNTFKNIDMDTVVNYLINAHNYSLLFWFYKNNKYDGLCHIENLAIKDNIPSIQQFVKYLQKKCTFVLQKETQKKYDNIYDDLSHFLNDHKFYDDNIMSIMCNKLSHYEINDHIEYLLHKSYKNNKFELINFLTLYYKKNIDNKLQ